MGELLVEVMRPEPDLPLGRPGPFVGPYPSGAPGIFIDAVARLGHRGGIVSGSATTTSGGSSPIGSRRDGVRTDHVEVVPGSQHGRGLHRLRRRWLARATSSTGPARPRSWHPCPLPSSQTARSFLHVMGCSLMADRAFAERIVETVERFAGPRRAHQPRPQRPPRAARRRTGSMSSSSPSCARHPCCCRARPSSAAARRGDDLDAAAAGLMRRYAHRARGGEARTTGCAVYHRRTSASTCRLRGDGGRPHGGRRLLRRRVPVRPARGHDARGGRAPGGRCRRAGRDRLGPMEGPVDRASVEAMLAEG